MSRRKGRHRPLLVRAAGGLLWRAGREGPELALVHRPRRRDWSLPKGKLEPGESFLTAALREVAEETGCRASPLGFAGWTFYLAGRRPKLVLFWHMATAFAGHFMPGEEVDEVAWLAPARALERLDHASERRLVERSEVPGTLEWPRSR